MAIPTIDFGPFLHGTKEDRERVSAEVYTAASTTGFFTLINCVEPEVVSEAFDKVKGFFSMNIKDKEALAWETPESNRGYVRQGRERVTQATTKQEVEVLRANAPDFKETMEIGKDCDSVWPNRWPEKQPDFRPWAIEFFETCHQLHLEVMRALAMGMNLGEHYFDDKVDQRAHNLRLLNYPPVARKLIESGGNRAGAHSDYGTVTLLFQDMVGGLEVQDRRGNFVPVTPVANSVVANLGDLLQRWSNGLLKSTVHRVVLPYGGNKSPITPQRNSIAFFSNPNLHQVIECLPGTGTPKFEPIQCEAYLVSRLTATYN